MSSYRPSPGYGYNSGIKKVESERRPNKISLDGGGAFQNRYRSLRGPPPMELQNVGNYRLIKTVGKGNFAKVKLAKHIPTGRQVAIKVIDKTLLSPTGKQKLCREVRVMKTLDHPHIVKLFEVMETEKYLYLVMEYASGGEIFDYLSSNGRLKEKDARIKFRQIISAVHYCHQKNIVHRDLKAENLLLDQDLNIKIADFGFSNEFNVGSKLDTFCGSPPYAAPELFLGKKYTGPEVDVWSLGVILYTLTSGSLPFDGPNLKELRERIIKGKYRIPFYVSTDCESLLKKFLVVNPAKRITLEAAMKDKWLNSGFEGSELEPYNEPPEVMYEDRIATMLNMGFTRDKIEESLGMHSYDDTAATYHLLGQRLSSLENSSSYSWSSISLGRTQSVNVPRLAQGPSALREGPSALRAPSHPATVCLASTTTPQKTSLLQTVLQPDKGYSRMHDASPIGNGVRQNSVGNALDYDCSVTSRETTFSSPPKKKKVPTATLR